MIKRGGGLAGAAAALFVLVAGQGLAQAQGGQEGTVPAPAPAQDQGQYGQPAQQQYGQPAPQQYGQPAQPVEPLEENPAPNSIWAEGLGAGLYYSINYERLVIPELGVRVGFEYLSFSVSAGSSSSSSSFVGIPITANYIGVHHGASALEVGAGPTLVYFSGSASAGTVSAEGSGLTAFGTVHVGYRLHPIGHAGFNFRVGLMMLIGRGLSFSADNPTKVGFLPWGYISFGASF